MSDTKQASRAFGNPVPSPSQLTLLTGGLPIPSDLRQVATTFVDLQDHRHDADYNLVRRFTQVEARTLVSHAESAFQCWRRVRTDPAAEYYLSSLLLWKRWGR